MDTLRYKFLLVSGSVFLEYLYLHCFGINTMTSFITLTTEYSYSALTTTSDIVTTTIIYEIAVILVVPSK